MTSPRPEVHTKKTAAEAGEPPEPGLVWDEEVQSWVPRGEAMLHAALARPLNLEEELVRWARDQATVLSFVKRYLEEAEYEQNAKGQPIPGKLIAGKLRDYYVVPGATTKALTKRGAAKTARLHRWAKGGTDLVEKTETMEYTSATVRVTLVDGYRRAAGSAVSSCTTAEAGFRSPNARKKYGAEGYWERGERGKYVETGPPDYRGALNDVVARAGKRAFVQAVIIAAGLDEIFSVALADEEGHREERPTRALPAQTGERVPAARQAPEKVERAAPPAPAVQRERERPGERRPKGTPITHLPFGDREALRDLSAEELGKKKGWCQRVNKFPDVVDAIDLELDRRRGES